MLTPKPLSIKHYHSHTLMLFTIYSINFRLWSDYIAYSSLYHIVEGTFFKLRHLADPTCSSLGATTLIYHLKTLIDYGLHSSSYYSPLSSFLPGGYNSNLRHSVAQTVAEALSSDYNLLFSSILQKLSSKKS